MSGQDSIFLSIAGFCDPYLRFTIESAFAEAAEPERLFVGVVDQTSEPLNDWLAQQTFADQVRYLHIDPVHSRGVCWARHLVQTLFDDEAFFLQVDSHTWFQSGWDRQLRKDLKSLGQLSDKPVLTIYPPGFEFDSAGQPTATRDLGSSVGFFRPKPDQALSADNRVLTFKAASLKPPDKLESSGALCWHYARGAHLAGGFVFAPGSFVREVPYDPGFYFHGEEQGLALRAFTWGWDLFHPQFKRVPLRHLYKLPKSASPNLHWRQDLEARRAVKWSERRRQARQRLNDLIGGRLQPPYGLGQRRSLREFIALSGLDYLADEIRISTPEVVSLQAAD